MRYPCNPVTKIVMEDIGSMLNAVYVFIPRCNNYLPELYSRTDVVNVQMYSRGLPSAVLCRWNAALQIMANVYICTHILKCQS